MKKEAALVVISVEKNAEIRGVEEPRYKKYKSAVFLDEDEFA